MILNYHNLPGKLFFSHTQNYDPQMRQPSWIYGKLVYFHQSDFRGFSFVDSELFGVLYFCHFMNCNKFGYFYNYDIYFFIKKSVLAFKYMFPSLYFCKLFICYIDTHVASNAIKINSVAFVLG